jgi:hypothetical protein
VFYPVMPILVPRQPSGALGTRNQHNIDGTHLAVEVIGQQTHTAQKPGRLRQSEGRSKAQHAVPHQDDTIITSRIVTWPSPSISSTG